MIISASRRTDIPNYYSEWFYNRIKEGFVYVRNPMNIHQVGKINLSRDVVDGMVFWTKNPQPMMKRLQEIDGYTYYFQFTLTSYGKDVEPNVPSKKDYIIPTFKNLSERIGKDKVIWRYDPIFINDKYNVEYHYKYFEVLASILSNYTEKCTVSFLDLYKKTERNTRFLHIKSLNLEDKLQILKDLSRIAHEYGIYIDTCAEDIETDCIGVPHASCIDKNRFERIGDYKLSIGKDKNQRGACGCIASIDIGAYNTCKNLCTYCYANFNKNMVKNNAGKHDPNSPLIFGHVGTEDMIKERKVKSCIECELNLFKND